MTAAPEITPTEQPDEADMEIIEIAGLASHGRNVIVEHINRRPKTKFADLLGPARAASAARAMARMVRRRTEPPGLDCRRSLYQSAAALSTMACAISLSSMLFIGEAVAQPPNGPIVNDRPLSATQEQVESPTGRNTAEGWRWDEHWTRWNERVAPDLDHLSREIMRAATPNKESPDD
jgi:hypothetical protein